MISSLSRRGSPRRSCWLSWPRLAHAALKLRRAYGGTNPTPVSPREAFNKLKEEIADVQLLLGMLDLDRHWPEYGRIKEAKLKRWIQRLGAAEEG